MAAGHREHGSPDAIPDARFSSGGMEREGRKEILFAVTTFTVGAGGGSGGMDNKIQADRTAGLCVGSPPSGGRHGGFIACVKGLVTRPAPFPQAVHTSTDLTEAQYQHKYG